MREYMPYEDEMMEFLLKKYLIKHQIESAGNSIDDTINLLDAHHQCELGIALIKSAQESIHNN